VFVEWLGQALSLAKAADAKLIVTKLDRLARNVAFLSALMRSGVDFVACDNPHATRLTIHILAAVAEDEAERIFTRVREALAAYKARGGLLGARHPRCRRMTRENALLGSRLAMEVNRRLAADFRLGIRPVIWEMRAGGKTLRETAAALNGQGYRTRRGKLWTLATVEAAMSSRIDARLGISNQLPKRLALPG